MIQVFQIQIQTTNYTAKYNPIAKNIVYIQIPATVITLTPCDDQITPHIT